MGSIGDSAMLSGWNCGWGRYRGWATTMLWYSGGGVCPRGPRCFGVLVRRYEGIARTGSSPGQQLSSPQLTRCPQAQNIYAAPRIEVITMMLKMMPNFCESVRQSQ